MSGILVRLPRSSAAVAAAFAALAVASCAGGEARPGAADTSASPSSHADHGDHGDKSMAGMDMGGSDDAPSTSAAMICSDEIAAAVTTTFALPSTPSRSDDWTDLLYTCSYSLPQGELTLTVKDSADEQSGLVYFKHFRTKLDVTNGVHAIKGLAGLGLPSFESDNGHVVFVKDGKTLHVDASGLELTGQGSAGRTEAAYQIATDVIACWSE